MLKKFGAYFVGVGIVVTGVLWYARDDGVVAGEDVAALINRAMDVHLIGRLMGDGTPDYWGDGGVNDAFGSNIVKGAVVSMEDLRKVSLRVEGLPQWQNPVWVDPQYSHLFEDGAEILTCTNRPVMVAVTNQYWVGGGYVDYEVREYRAVTPTPVSRVRSLGSRAHNGAMPFERGVSPTNEPVCRFLHGGAGFAWDYPMWPDGSFWTPEMGAKAYTLPFKANHAADAHTVRVRPAVLSWMRLADNAMNRVDGLSVTLGAYRFYALTDYPPYGSQMYALLDVTGPSGHQYSVAAAYPFGSPQITLEGPWAVALADGVNTIRVRRTVPLPADGRLRAELVRKPSAYWAEGCDVRTNDVSGYYDVKVWDFTGTAHQANLLRLWLEVPGIEPVYTHVAVGPGPSATPAGPLRISPFVREPSYGSAGFDVSLAAGAPAATVYDRTVTRRNLDAARAVLTNCTVSVYVANAPFLSASHTSLSYRSDYVRGEGPFGTGLDGMFASLSLFSVSPDYPSAGHICDILVDYYAGRHEGYPWEYDGYIYRFNRVSEKTLTLAYPSAYAVTNGHVSRIRVFAVCGYTEESAVGDGPNGAWTPGTVHAQGYTAATLPLEGLPFLSTCDESAVDKTGGPGGHYEDNYNSVHGFRGITLNKVYDVYSPSSKGDLTFTWELPEITPANPGAPSVRSFHPSPYGYRETEWLRYSLRVNDLAYVIVVDWDWGG